MWRTVIRWRPTKCTLLGSLLNFALSQKMTFENEMFHFFHIYICSRNLSLSLSLSSSIYIFLNLSIYYILSLSLSSLSFNALSSIHHCPSFLNILFHSVPYSFFLIMNIALFLSFSLSTFLLFSLFTLIHTLQTSYTTHTLQ
jgi:hypothetical protein